MISRGPVRFRIPTKLITITCLTLFCVGIVWHAIVSNAPKKKPSTADRLSKIASPLQCSEPNIRMCCTGIAEVETPLITNLFVLLKMKHDFNDGGVAVRCKPMDMFGMGVDGFCGMEPACCDPNGIHKDGELVLGCRSIDVGMSEF